MSYDDVLFLLNETPTTDSIGNTTYTYTETQVFCNVKSISQTEHYQAASNGLKPECKFVLADYLDYNGQKKVKYNNLVYIVERNFRTGDELEIVVTK